MLLIAGMPGEFAKIMEVITWIVLPLLVFSFLTTILLHYGRKWRNNREEENIPNDIGNAIPESFCYKTGDGTLVYLDHTGLLRDLRNKVSYHHARFAALKQDYKKLESGNPGIFQNNDKTYSMEQEEKQTGINGIHLDQHPAAYKEEYRVLKDKIAEQEYLKEVLVEKKAQIDFLQNQLEQRIKMTHQSEQQKEELCNENKNLGHEISRLENELASSKEEITNVKKEITSKEIQLQEIREASSSSASQVIWLENSLQELKQQNELLNAAAGDNNDTITSLRELLEKEQQRAVMAEQKLLSNKELLARLYKDFTAFISEEETSASPVIPLNAGYTKAGWVESVVEG
jgi:chromosome segregation ATPase